MAKLRVRVYNVRFGDAVLVTIPDRAPNGSVAKRHMLIDVGNVLSGAGGADELFRPVLADIQKQLAGQPLDLYVMTHEHLDHIQGLFYGAEKLGVRFNVTHAWLTASAAPDYYDTHPEAKRKRLQMEAAYEQIAQFLRAAPELETPYVRALMHNNNPRDTGQCVDYLRSLAQKTTYVHRGVDLTGAHPFQEAQFEVWAPEEDTADYYRGLVPMALAVSPDSGASALPGLTEPLPPAGVDAGAFYNLVEMRRRGYGSNLLAIDRAANNTSVVVSLEWRGWRLLFPGDAEYRSWKMMEQHGVLQPVQFLKISHHGSHNGTPDVELLDKVLPPRAGRRRRRAVLSTYPDTYGGVPDAETLALIQSRCAVTSVEGLTDGAYVDIEFTG